MNLITLALAKKYTDEKAGYVESAEKILDVALSNTDGISVYEGAFIKLEVGKTYTVALASGSYTAVCKYAAGVGWMLGNQAIGGVSDADTGESFFFFAQQDEKQSVSFLIDVNGGNHCTISTAETIHTIDPKYIPGAVLPVVELSGVPSEHGYALTADESAVAETVMSACMPFVLRFTEDGVPCAYVMNITQESGIKTGIANIGNLQYYLYDAGEGFMAVKMVM